MEPTHRQALAWGLPAAEVEAARQRDLQRLRAMPQPRSKAQKVAYIRALLRLSEAAPQTPNSDAGQRAPG